MALGIVAFIVAFLLLIAIHEAGHFIAAKSAGVAVRTFSIGMGPKIASFTPKNTPNPTTYQLAALPIGGYCAIAGMTNLDNADDVDENARFDHAPLHTRICIMLAGIAINIVAGLLLIAALAATTVFPNVRADVRPVIAEVHADSPADKAGLARNLDATITAVGDTPVARRSDVSQTLQRYPEKTVALTLDDNGQTRTVDVTPTNTGTIGIMMRTREPEAREATSAADALTLASTYTVSLVDQTVRSIVALPSMVAPAVKAITGAEERGSDSPMSIVGASRISGEIVKMDAWSSFALMMANFSIFLGLFNLIPIPPLDGGHVMINLIGAANKRRKGTPNASGIGVDYAKFTWITAVAALLLLGFGLLILVADIVAPVTLQ